MSSNGGNYLLFVVRKVDIFSLPFKNYYFMLYTACTADLQKATLFMADKCSNLSV
jgi:hypothetical protein